MSSLFMKIFMIFVLHLTDQKFCTSHLPPKNPKLADLATVTGFKPAVKASATGGRCRFCRPPNVACIRFRPSYDATKGTLPSQPTRRT